LTKEGGFLGGDKDSGGDRELSYIAVGDRYVNFNSPVWAFLRYPELRMAGDAFRAT